MSPFALRHPLPPRHLLAGTKRAIYVGEEKRTIVVRDVWKRHVSIEKRECIALRRSECRVEDSKQFGLLQFGLA